MGRRKKETNEAAILLQRSQGASIKSISQDLGISTATLSRRIAELQHKQGILTKYRELQGLELTGLQLRMLESLTPEKMSQASLSELLSCFHILKKVEMAIQGKGNLKITGLLQYLVEMEKEESH
jgi:transposase-like protein